MKRFLIMTVLIATIGISIFASGDAESDSEKQEVTVIQIATSGGPEEIKIRESIGNLYTQKNPNIQIEWVDIGFERFQKLMTLIAGGQAPDILYMNEFAFAFADKGVLYPLDSFIEADADFDLDLFYEGLITPLTWEGKLYGLPQEVSPYVIYYNKEMFDRAGLDYPADDWTQEEFLQAASALTDADTNEYGYRHPGNFWHDQYQQWLYRSGVDLFSENMEENGVASQKMLDGLRFLEKMMVEYHVSPNPAESQAMGQGFNAMFRSEKVAMEAMGLWMLPDYLADPPTFEWDIVSVPKGKNQSTKAGVLNWAISSTSDHTEIAWDILKFFTGPEGMMEIAKSSMALPGSRDQASNQLMLDAGFPQNFQAFIDGAENLDLTDQMSPKRNEVLTAIASEVDLLMLGKTTPEETQSAIIEKVTKILF